MDKAIDLSRTENKATAKLERVFLDPMLAMARCLCLLATGKVVLAQHVENVGFPQLKRRISLALLVHQERKGDSRLFDEGPGEIEVAQPDGGERGSPARELILMIAQLRDLLTAKDSAIVPQENEHGGSGGPQEIELNGLLVGIGKNDPGEAIGIESLHGG